MSTSIMRTARGHGIAALGAVLAFTVSACGSGSDRPGADRSSAPSESATDLGPVRVQYRYEETIAGEKSRIEWEVITGQAHRSRFTVTGGFNADGPAIGTYYIYDGKVLLTYEPDGDPKYRLTKDPAPADINGLLIAAPDSQLFARFCPKAERRGEQTVLGRDAVSYACAPSATQKEDGAPDNLVLDAATGLVLRAGPLVVTQLQFNPPTTAATFSTEIPDDPGYAPLSFVVPRVGGGYLVLDDYLGRPLLVITGDAAGIRSLANRLAPLTKHGQSPRVIALLIALPPANWNGSLLDDSDDDDAALAASISRQVGDLGVPTVIDFKGGAAGGPISGPAGVQPGETRPAAVGFLRSDGILAAILTEHATTAQLAHQIAQLR